MPLSQKHLRSKRRTVTKPFEDDPEQLLTITYKIHAFNVEEASEYSGRLLSLAQLNGDAQDISAMKVQDVAALAGKAKDINDIYADFLSRVVVEWDLLDDDDQVIPVDKQSILAKALPDTLSFAFGMVMEDKKGGKDSPAESPPS